MNEEATAAAPTSSSVQPSSGLNSPVPNNNASVGTVLNSARGSENLEEILLDLSNFEKEVSKAGSLLDLTIPSSLESYLKLVANAGSAQFPWTKIKPLFRVKLEQVIHEFNTSSPTAEIPAMPNVDPFNFDAVKGKVFEQLEAFIGIPFTVQRLAELLTSPRRHYRRTDKFMRALEKNMLVVSTVEARAVAAAASSNDGSSPTTLSVLNGDHSVLPSNSSPLRRAASPTSSGFVKAAKLMDSRDDKAADVKSSDADAEGDNEDDKPMDDSPTSNDDDAEESTSTTQNADTKSSDSGEGSSDSEAVARVAGEDKEATEDKESTMESDASVPGDADAASSSSDVAKMEDSDAEQSDVPTEDKSVETPVGTTTDAVDNVAADSDEPGVKPDEGKPDTSDAGPCDSADAAPNSSDPTDSSDAAETEKSEVGSSEPRETDAATSSEAKEEDPKEASDNSVGTNDQNTHATSSKSDVSENAGDSSSSSSNDVDDMEIDAECSSSETQIHTSSN